MDSGKWMERYSVDCKLKYPSLATQKNYISGVSLFLHHFKDYEQPKAIPTDQIKSPLSTINI